MTRYFNERTVVLFALLLLAAGLFHATYSFDYSDVGSAHSPVFFPRIILLIWMGLAAIAIVQSILGKEHSSKIESYSRLAMLVIASVVYSNCIVPFGFFISSAVFSLICLPVFGMRKPLIVLLYSIVVPGALVLLFNHILKMPLPTSPFTHYF